MLPLRSFWYSAKSVTWVAAEGRQVSEGATRRYNSVPSAFSGPVRSAAICLCAWLPSCTASSRCVSASGRLEIMLTTPPGPFWPAISDEGPRSTSMRSKA